MCEKACAICIDASPLHVSQDDRDKLAKPPVREAFFLSYDFTFMFWTNHTFGFLFLRSHL